MVPFLAKTSTRVIAVTLLIFILLLLLVHWANTLLNVDRAMEVYDLNEKESARLASNLFFSKMTAIAQTTIALVAGAWALITLSDIRVRVEGLTSVICFVLANLGFGLSLWIYAIGYDFIVIRVFHHATFDIDAPFIDSVMTSQQSLFLYGLVALMMSVLFGGRRHDSRA